MGQYKIYCCLKKAIKDGVLKEPFSTEDFKNVCGDIISGDTYKVFLNKHKKDNEGNESELFIKDEDAKTYSLIRPFKNYKCENNA